VTAIQAISASPFISGASQATVKRIRALQAPAGTTMLVGGATADFVDFQASLARHLPIALAIVVLATLTILFLMTGSVVLPVKSLLMNFLNLSAVFGLLVLIFQDGRLEGFLAYASPGAIEQTMPILLFAVAFGLSTDYAVFLLSRIKEARDHGASDSESVAIGLERTGRIVTAAALLFAVAMFAFATSKIIFIKENGVGTALAVLIDASVIRALLVPSLMELLGKWNWWAPAPLRRLHERFGIRETTLPEGA
jgi:RND superfamily putative drug exporter